MGALIDKLNELHAAGKLDYWDYSELFDMASELEANSCFVVRDILPKLPTVGDSVCRFHRVDDKIEIAETTITAIDINYLSSTRSKLTVYLQSPIAGNERSFVVSRDTVEALSKPYVVIDRYYFCTKEEAELKLVEN